MNNIIENIIYILIGAVISTFTSWLQRRDERKRFELERRDKYKLMAVEKRLEAHQKAFVHSVALIGAIHENDESKRSKVLADAYEFWVNYSLYLEKETRLQFRYCVSLVSMYKMDIQFWREEENLFEKRKKSEQIQMNWETIQNLPNIIQKEVELEPIKIKPEYDAQGNKIK